MANCYYGTLRIIDLISFSHSCISSEQSITKEKLIVFLNVSINFSRSKNVWILSCRTSHLIKRKKPVSLWRNKIFDLIGRRFYVSKMSSRDTDDFSEAACFLETSEESSVQTSDSTQIIFIIWDRARTCGRIFSETSEHISRRRNRSRNLAFSHSRGRQLKCYDIHEIFKKTLSKLLSRRRDKLH